ncbi:hypothetical protein SAMN05216196_102414 [Lutimaribacter pacificus]|uniref:SpoIIAA-like n=1 Tax=Lutimaribacter pacificus TaxID=391948 RepID=A0A1H0EZL4_9RHOB|nr:hypothetical protein [Lutimaribacter pacificus]SDN87775.1 hypothetical protein SAMN05216196_102414 [Lutimaribacter pacificus]SHK42908.1 hypothetical protein SAMN05444142_105128 [Lutimaribacter pacificus]
MIGFYLRNDLKLTLLRFHGQVSLVQMRDVATATILDNDTPPFDCVALIDTREADQYDARFTEVLGFTDWLRSIFACEGHELRLVILTRESWKYGMAHMFAIAAKAVGGIHVRLCQSEDEVMQHCTIPGGTLDTLFGPDHLFYTTIRGSDPSGR